MPESERIFNFFLVVVVVISMTHFIRKTFSPLFFSFPKNCSSLYKMAILFALLYLMINWSFFYVAIVSLMSKLYNINTRKKKYDHSVCMKCLQYLVFPLNISNFFCRIAITMIWREWEKEKKNIADANDSRCLIIIY